MITFYGSALNSKANSVAHRSMQYKTILLVAAWGQPVWSGTAHHVLACLHASLHSLVTLGLSLPAVKMKYWSRELWSASLVNGCIRVSMSRYWSNISGGKIIIRRKASPCLIHLCLKCLMWSDDLEIYFDTVDGRYWNVLHVPSKQGIMCSHLHYAGCWNGLVGSFSCYLFAL